VSGRKTLAIIQSCYIPWKGYFDLINAADEFVLYDDVQYTTNDWRNRNRIKTPQGTQWLTIPIARRLGQRIDEARVADPRWAAKHWRTLTQNYARAEWFGRYRALFEPIYEELASEPLLSRINRRLLDAVCEELGITTPLRWSSEYEAAGEGSARVLALCLEVGATRYLSGPRGRDYIDEAAFADAGVEIEYVDYDGYHEYPQLHPPFDHHVTVLDLLFNVGPEAGRYLKTLVDASVAGA
jgi:hypothetical protein